MHHDGSGVLGVAILHLFQELEHANRGERHPEIWPAGKVELGDKPLRFLPGHVSHLKHTPRQVFLGISFILKCFPVFLS